MTAKKPFGILHFLGLCGILLMFWSDCSHSFRSGTCAQLSAPNLAEIPVCLTKADLESLVRSASEPGIPRSASTFYVPVNTNVRVLHGGFAAAEVYITEGTFAGQTGWVPKEWIK